MTALSQRLLAVSAFCIIILQLQAQEKELIESFRAYHGALPVEKVYLHTDKEVYAPGETLWLGAYLVEGTLHQQSPLSEVAYAELLDPKDSLLARISMKLVNGAADGDIVIGDSLATGEYTLRGYSHYQRNFDPEFIFSKTIYLVDSKIAADSTTTEPVTGPFDFQYFPEGGDMVSGLPSAVAFKAVDARGNGVDVEGELVSMDGSLTVPFRSEHLGMGRLMFTPEKGKSYQMKYRIAGQEFTTNMRKPLDKGARLSVRQSSKTFTVTGSVSEGMDLNDCLVVGHVRGQLYLIARPEAGRASIYAQVPHNRMPNGIIHLTLFYQGKPVQERLIFNQNNELLPKVAFTGQNLTRRQKTSFKININTAAGSPVAGKVSVAILGDYIQPNQIDIFGYLNVFSDLKGNIENPGTYFDPSNAKRQTHLDLLMMTQGWRRFVWQDILDTKLPEVTYFAEKGFSIEGQLTNYYKRNKPEPGTVLLSFLENLLFKEEVETDENGYFYYDGMDINDSVTVMVQAVKKGKKDKIKRETGTFVTINEPDSLPLAMTLRTALNTDADEKFAEVLSEVEEQTYKTDGVIELEAVDVSARKIAPVIDNPFRRPSMLHGEPQSRMVMDSVPGSDTYTNMFTLLRARARGISIEGTIGNRRALYRGTPASFMVDGVITTPDYIESMDPNQVEFVEVIGAIQAAVYGVNGGIVAVYTRQGYTPDSEEEDPRGIQVFRHVGYHQAREFYTPNYDSMSVEESLAKDLRTTQYWSGVKTLEGGALKLEYTASDDLGNFVLYLEGLTDDGEPFTAQHRFEMKDF